MGVLVSFKLMVAITHTSHFDELLGFKGLQVSLSCQAFLGKGLCRVEGLKCGGPRGASIDDSLIRLLF